MLAYIKGKIEIKSDEYIVIDVGGLGYKIFMSGISIQNIGEIGEQVKVHTYYRVREDDISIFGFITQEELKMFELLLTVSGVGAKVALAILANISVTDFAIAVINEDVTKIVQVPGIGKKSAERIILELKDKLKKIQQEDKITEGVSTNIKIEKAIEQNNNIQEAISALQVLGYNKKEIEKALEKIEKENITTEDIIRKGLAVLGQ
jgi:Holliday junction DNA helicase RuvA